MSHHENEGGWLAEALVQGCCEVTLKALWKAGQGTVQHLSQELEHGVLIPGGPAAMPRSLDLQI